VPKLTLFSFFFFRYQFNPDLYNPDVVVNILVKALASVPFPDFNLSVALLDEKASNANMDEPDPLPSLLPYLTNLHSLLQQCRFPAFWALYRSDALEPLRDNYTVEVVGFEDSIREVAVRAVKATFQKIGGKRLGSYLDLEGNPTFFMCTLPIRLINIRSGAGRLYCEAWVEL
jgi:translation initiation factor 3 subunit K